jgi:hypothetical protein
MATSGLSRPPAIHKRSSTNSSDTATPIVLRNNQKLPQRDNEYNDDCFAFPAPCLLRREAFQTPHRFHNEAFETDSDRQSKQQSEGQIESMANSAKVKK